MTVLITGAAGQLGTELLHQLQTGACALGKIPAELENANVVCVDLPDADLSDIKQTTALILKHTPDIVFNCAAFTNVDGAETNKDTAFAANAIAPRNLAMACEEIGARLVHVSTDYVFSGMPGKPFSESDVPMPSSVYGSTKLLGEQYAMRYCSKTFVARTAWLYGKNGNNFVKTMLRLADEKDSLNVINDQHGNPTNAEDLAYHLLHISCTQEYGIYHITGGGTTTWYDFAMEIFRLAKKDIPVTPCTSDEYKTAAKRPLNSALEHTMLRLTVGDHMRPWQDALAAYLQEYLDSL